MTYDPAIVPSTVPYHDSIFKDPGTQTSQVHESQPSYSGKARKARDSTLPKTASDKASDQKPTSASPRPTRSPEAPEKSRGDPALSSIRRSQIHSKTVTFAPSPPASNGKGKNAAPPAPGKHSHRSHTLQGSHHPRLSQSSEADPATTHDYDNESAPSSCPELKNHSRRSPGQLSTSRHSEDRSNRIEELRIPTRTTRRGSTDDYAPARRSDGDGAENTTRPSRAPDRCDESHKRSDTPSATRRAEPDKGKARARFPFESALPLFDSQLAAGSDKGTMVVSRRRDSTPHANRGREEGPGRSGRPGPTLGQGVVESGMSVGEYLRLPTGPERRATPAATVQGQGNVQQASGSEMVRAGDQPRQRVSINFPPGQPPPVMHIQVVVNSNQYHNHGDYYGGRGYRHGHGRSHGCGRDCCCKR